MTASNKQPIRRQFLKTSTAAVVAASSLSVERAAHAAGSDVIKIGMIGAGGRCAGAAKEAIETTLKYYVAQDADEIADGLWKAFPADDPVTAPEEVDEPPKN